jgi:hypothetical protein
MGRKFLNYLSLTCKQGLFASGAFLFLISSTACTKSPNGSVEELIKTNPPNFQGSLIKTFWSPSTTYQLDGSCDPIAYGTEWSYNNSSWTEFAGAGGCPNGTFTLTINFSSRKIVYVRARTKTGFTATAIATVRLQLPPTSHQLNLVNASASDDEEGQGMQAALESVALSVATSNGLRILRTSGIDAAYAQ